MRFELARASSRRSFLQAATGIGAAGLCSPAVATVEKVAVDHVPGAGNAIGPQDVDSKALSPPLTSRGEVETAVDLALSSIVRDGADHLFPGQFEVQRLASDPAFRDWAAASLVNNLMLPANRIASLAVYPAFVPKFGKHSYRLCAWQGAFEAARYLAVTILIARQLGGRDATVSHRIFSHRFAPTDFQLFDETVGYESFLSQVLARLDCEPQVILVQADVADCYPSIELGRLAAALGEAGVEPWLVATLRRLLGAWSDRWGGGLPVGCEASHILAEAFLIEIDRELHDQGLEFVRFVDDYRLLAPSPAAAQVWLARLSEALARRGLSLNQSKTYVQSISRSDYEELLTARATARSWGSLGVEASLKIAQSPTISLKKKHKNKKSTPSDQPPSQQLPSQYNTEPPPKRTPPQHSEYDFLHSVSTDFILSKLQNQARTRGYISFGNFRLLVEATVQMGEFDRLVDAYEFVDLCPKLLAYLVAVFIQERNSIPKPIRDTITDCFAERLSASNIMPDYDIFHIALLLGSPEYEGRGALRQYFEEHIKTLSPLVARTILDAIRSTYDTASALRLLEIGSTADPFIRAAALDVAWPHIDDDARTILAGDALPPMSNHGIGALLSTAAALSNKSQMC